MAQRHKPAGHKPPHTAAQGATETDTFQGPKAMGDGRLRHRYEACCEELCGVLLRATP
jgi:hypothetical protein